MCESRFCEQLFYLCQEEMNAAREALDDERMANLMTCLAGQLGWSIADVCEGEKAAIQEALCRIGEVIAEGSAEFIEDRKLL